MGAYSDPPTFTLGDQPTAALMNVYSDDIVHLYEVLGNNGVLLQPAVLVSNDGKDIITNVYRWLR